MKTRNLLSAFAAVMTISMAVSCQEPETPAKEITFPEPQELSIGIDRSIDIVFTAEADWKISIDKQWLVFVDGDAKVSQLSGQAGEVTCTVTTTDVTSIFEAETAVIDITMDDKTQTLCTVTRVPAERWAKMWTVPYGGDAEEIETLKLEYTGKEPSVKFTFTANYDWTLKSVPEWMTVSPDLFSGEAGETFEAKDVKNFARLKDISYMPFAQEGDIELTDRNGENTVIFKAEYTGMGETDCETYYGSRPMNSSKGVSFSEKGFVMSFDYTPVPTEEKTATFSVYTSNQDFEIMTLYQKDMMGTMYWFAFPSWVTAEKGESGQVNVTMKENTETSERTAYLLIVPKAMQPEDPAQMNQGWFRQNKEKFEPTDAAPSPYMIKLTQNAMQVSGGFIAGWSTSAIECVPFSEYPMFAGMKPSEMRAGLPDDNTYVAELVPPTTNTYSLQVAPLGFDAEWMPYLNGSLDTPLFKLIAYSGTWPKDDVFSYANVYKGMKSYPGISYARSAIDQVKENSMAYLMFFKDETVNEKKPSAVLVLIKK